MDKAEMKHIEEIKRLEEAVGKTNSEYLRNDYMKAIKRMKRELKEYRRFKRER